MQFKDIDNVPVPSGPGDSNNLADVVLKVRQMVPGAHLNSCYRGTDPAGVAILHRHGKKTQAQLWYGWVHRIPGYNPANPPNESTHECRSDGVAYAGPRGRKLSGVECGQDWEVEDVGAVMRAYRKLGWIVVRPYPDGREKQHLNVRKRGPRIAGVFLPMKRNAKGPHVFVLTHRLAICGWLPHSGVWFNARVDEAVRRFQRYHKLEADGIVGAHTWVASDVAAKRCKRVKRKETKHPS